MESSWLEVTLTAPGERLEELAAILTGRGVTGMVIEDEADFQQFLEQNRQYWDYVDEELLEQMKGAARIKLYVTDDADGEATFHAWTDGLGDWVAPAATDWAASALYSARGGVMMSGGTGAMRKDLGGGTFLCMHLGAREF